MNSRHTLFARSALVACLTLLVVGTGVFAATLTPPDNITVTPSTVYKDQAMTAVAIGQYAGDTLHYSWRKSTDGGTTYGS